MGTLKLLPDTHAPTFPRAASPPATPGPDPTSTTQCRPRDLWPGRQETQHCQRRSSECPLLPVTAGCVCEERFTVFEERVTLSRSTGILAHSRSLSLHHQPGSAPLSPQLTPRNQAPEGVCGLSGLFLLPWRNTALYHPPRPRLSPCVMFACPSQGPVGARAKCSERGALAGADSRLQPRSRGRGRQVPSRTP